MSQGPRYTSSPPRSRYRLDSPARRPRDMEHRNPCGEPASTASSIMRAHCGDGFSNVSMTDADPPPSRPPPVASTASSHEYPRAPPPAAHRGTTSSIGTNSYMDYDTDDIPSPSIHSSISQRTPRQYPYQDQPFQSAPRRPQQAALEEYYRQYQDPRRLLPTEVRPPVSFAYELEPAGYAGSHQQYYGTSEHQLERPHQEESHLQAVPGTARQILHSEVDMAFSRPYQWQNAYRPRAPPPPLGVDSQFDWQSKEVYGRPFVYEQDRAYTASSASGSAAEFRDTRGANSRRREEHEDLSRSPRRAARCREKQTSPHGGSQKGAYGLQRFVYPIETAQDRPRADSSRNRTRWIRDDSTLIEMETPRGTRVRYYEEYLEEE